MDTGNADKVFNEMFRALNSYEIKNASEEQIKLYQKAYKLFKENNKETKATLILNLNNNSIEMKYFNGLDMYKFGYNVAKCE